MVLSALTTVSVCLKLMELLTVSAPSEHYPYVVKHCVLCLLIYIFACGVVGENRQTGVSGSLVSWEHFFHSLMLYHENMRRDAPSVDSTQYRHLPIRGITQRELEGLTAFLQLLTTIITWVFHMYKIIESSHFTV